MCLTDKAIYQTILGVSLAFTSGLYFSNSNAIIDYLKLYFNECMFARYSLQVATFLAVVLSLNVKPVNGGQTNDNSEQIGLLENADEEEELTYLPIYNDPDEQFLIRHKFSPISKRSENSQPSANPQANVEEFKESYGKF